MKHFLISLMIALENVAQYYGRVDAFQCLIASHGKTLNMSMMECFFFESICRPGGSV